MENLTNKEDFKGRVREWATNLGVEIRSLTVRPMRNKWASCSTRGCLTFNAELLEIECELCDYVIVHELLHLSTPNHGKLWKSLMLAHLGDYQALEDRLKKAAIGSV